MGNRAVITTSNEKENIKYSNDLGIYVHWNGGRDSVEAFLTYCRICGYRKPEEDNYGWSYLCSVICNFFGSGLSCGIDKCCSLDCDNYDNGVYVIKDWRVTDRYYDDSPDEYEFDKDEMIENLIYIDSCQPVSCQLGSEKIKELLEKELKNESKS